MTKASKHMKIANIRSKFGSQKQKMSGFLWDTVLEYSEARDFVTAGWSQFSQCFLKIYYISEESWYVSTSELRVHLTFREWNLEFHTWCLIKTTWSLYLFKCKTFESLTNKLYKKNWVWPFRFSFVGFSGYSLDTCRFFICSDVLGSKLVLFEQKPISLNHPWIEGTLVIENSSKVSVGLNWRLCKIIFFLETMPQNFGCLLALGYNLSQNSSQVFILQFYHYLQSPLSKLKSFWNTMFIFLVFVITAERDTYGGHVYT
jgi:hypothetical protein